MTGAKSTPPHYDRSDWWYRHEPARYGFTGPCYGVSRIHRDRATLRESTKHVGYVGKLEDGRWRGYNPEVGHEVFGATRGAVTLELYSQAQARGLA